MAAKLEDITGQKFVRLTAISFQGFTTSKKRRSLWLFRCDCGVEKVITAHTVKSGDCKSCGCLRGDMEINYSKTHGMTNATEYEIWRGIKARCTNPNKAAYKNYGGRGIKVCDRWLESFENFYEDMGARPEGRSLDRIDNNKDYCKENCRWATRKEQSRNTRRTIKVEYSGKTYCLKDLCSHIGGLEYRTICAKLQSGMATIDQLIRGARLAV